MDWNRIEHLLERYYEGETSLQEEQEMKQALQHPEVPAHLKAEAAMMTYLATAQQESAQARFQLPASPKVVPIQKKANFYLLRKFVAAAAVVLLVAAGIKFLTPNSPKTEQQFLAKINNEEIYDEEIAIQETQKALLLVSQKLNKGTNELSHLKTLNKPKEITSKINKKLNK